MLKVIKVKKYGIGQVLIIGAVLMGASNFAVASIGTCAGSAQGTAINSYGTGAANGCSAGGTGIIDFVNFSNTSGPSVWSATGAPGSARFDTSSATTANQFYMDDNNLAGVGNFTTFTYEATNGTGKMTQAALSTTQTFTCFFGSCTYPNIIGSLSMTICAGATFSSACTAGASGNEITIKETFTATGSTTGTEAFTCTQGTGVATGLACASGTANFATVSSSITALAVQLSMTATTNGGGINGFGDRVYISDIGNSFIPEPSTFVMLGSALLGLGGLHFRRRKRSARTSASSETASL